ncbi:prostaglandin D2 receptor 2 [Amia ocellicauda]|uniref:prostaglandin D2 receptor 2 n=1 Tax=Amia ocellicauda TaxID=2972642 RepID=UPI003464579A
MAENNLFCPLIQQMINHSVNSNNSDSSINYTTVCLHGILSVFGILENILILWVIGFRVRRTVISVWILNLAASDLLATVSLPFFTHFLAMGHTWTLGTTFCKIHSSMFFLNMFVSGFLLSVISLDRCLVVILPVWSQNHRDVRLATQVCAGIWVLAIINTIPYYIFRDTIVRKDGRIMCYYNYVQYRSPDDEIDQLCGVRQDILAVSKFIISFLLPLIIIIGSYMAVSSSITRRGRRRTYRFFRLVLAVIITFIVCWIPYHIFSLLEAASHYHHSLRLVVARALPLVSSLAFINSVLNPFLYVFSCPDFMAKIRQSLSVVMESVLMEDMDFSHRRSTTRSSVSTSELLSRGQKLRGHREKLGSTEKEEENPAVF